MLMSMYVIFDLQIRPTMAVVKMISSGIANIAGILNMIYIIWIYNGVMINYLMIIT